VIFLLVILNRFLVGNCLAEIKVPTSFILGRKFQGNYSYLKILNENLANSNAYSYSVVNPVLNSRFMVVIITKIYLNFTQCNILFSCSFPCIE